MFERVLVPLDGSTTAERALPWAFALVTRPGGEVVLLRVPQPRTMFFPSHRDALGYELAWPEQALDRDRDETRTYLDTLRAAWAQPDVTIETAVEGNGTDPAETIIQVAEARHADIIVMSTHGYSGLTRWLLGSVTEKVLRGAAVPVLVVRTELLPRRVLVPLDGSELAEGALPYALAIARQTGASVTLFHALQVPELDPRDIEYLESIERGLGRQFREVSRIHATEYLKQRLEPFRGAGVQADFAVVEAEEAAEAIVDTAEEQGFDLVVMATHGRTGLSRWVYGSVTEKVLRAGRTSMLVVPVLRMAHRPSLDLAQEPAATG